MSSPFESIFQRSPNFSKLKVFGCLCYPWLGPYTSHKLDSKSKPCVFLGYSLSQSAFLCFDKSTGKIHVSRHFQFVESVFPYQSCSTVPSRPSSSVSNWIPPTITVPSSSPQLASSAPSLQHQLDASPPMGSSSHPPPSSSHAATESSSQSQVQSSSSLPLTTTDTIPNTTLPPQSLSSHPMITRSKHNIKKPTQKLTLHTIKSSKSITEPSSSSQALKDPNWRKAMFEEYDALVRNGTWELVSPDCVTNLVGCRWVYRIKRNSDGSINRFKARLVAKGFHQHPGIDYHETFSPVIKPTTVRLVLSLAVSRNWSIKQLDINNAFLQGCLTESVFMTQPPGFIDNDKPNFVCKLHKAIYGLKQAPRAWYNELRHFLLESGFRNSHADASLFVFHSAHHIIYLLVYVDDIIVTGNNDAALLQFMSSLANRFSLKDLGNLSYFLGVEVLPHKHGLLLSQRRYIKDLLNRVNMQEANPVLTPLPTSASAISLKSGSPISDPSSYREVVGSLQYLSLTRPDVSFAVNKLSQFMHSPNDTHWVLVKRILRYLLGTIDKGLLRRDSPSSLHAFADNLHAFRMPIGLETKMIIPPLVPTSSILEAISFPGVQRSKRPSPDLRQKLSTAQLQPLPLN